MKVKINKEILEKLVDHRQKLAGEKCHFSKRELRGIENFLFGLREVIEKKLLVDTISLKLLNIIEKDLESSAGKDGVLLGLKWFQEEVLLLLPAELVYETVCLYEGGNRFPVLQQIENRDLTIFSYFILQVISSYELFKSQKIYLSKVAKISEEFRERKMLEENRENQNIRVMLGISSVEYPINIRFSNKILKRIQSYLRLNLYKRAIFSEVNLPFSITMKVSNFPLSSALNFAKGEQIEFNQPNIFWKLRLASAKGNFNEINLTCISIGEKRGMQFKFT